MVLRDHEQVEAMILIHSALSDDKCTVVNSVEAELTNMDLKSISAGSLPDPHTLRKSSHLLGSKVLQEFEQSAAFETWAHRSVVTGTKQLKPCSKNESSKPSSRTKASSKNESSKP